MKSLLKHILLICLAFGALIAYGCSESGHHNDDPIVSVDYGAIYGIAVDAENAEPMRGVQVQLCTKAGSTLSSTVTYDDGHFEFADINPGQYTVIISSTKYPNVSYDFMVEAGRMSSLDIPLGLYTNPYMPIYLSYKYNYGYEIHLTTPDIESIDPVDIGVYYSEKDNPMSTGARASQYDVNEYHFSGERTTMFFVQAYIKDSKGNTYMSEIIRITDEACAPKVKTVGIVKINTSKAILEGEIIHKGNPVYSERGFIVSIDYPNPTLQDLSEATVKIPVEGTELTYKSVIDLEEDIKYYVRAYAINEGYIGYGNVIKIEDYAPEVKTGGVSDVTTDHAIISAEITEFGDPKFNERGFIVSSELKNPTFSDLSGKTFRVVVEGTSQKFEKELINLEKETQYFYRAYVKSNKFTSYGEVQTFTTEDGREWYEIGSLAIQFTDLSTSATWSAANTMCSESRVGGFKDWRLPTQAEAMIMYANRSSIELSGVGYWTSTSSQEYTEYGHLYLYNSYGNGSGNFYHSSDTKLKTVRCIRNIKE